MASICSSNITSGFVDLATYDEIEKYMYGGEDALAYFVRETRKSSWFTQIPVVLTRNAGTPAFGQEWSANISRAGDYLLNCWLRVTTPAVTLAAANQFGANGRLRWCRNFMHNLVRECCLSFNDLVAAKLDSFHLDFWAAFTVPAGKRNGYNNMIGNFPEMTDPVANPAVPNFTSVLAAQTLNLPLPFFFCRDTGVALPTAALPYNNMALTFSFRNWNELLIIDNLAAVGQQSFAPALADVGGTAPVLGATQVWATYAIVSTDERELMGCGSRDMLIEQAQMAPRQTFNPSNNPNPSYDVRFSHAVKVLFFAVRNTTIPGEWSNYTAASPVPGSTVVNTSPSGALDPILETSLVYENTQRLAAMGSDYYCLVAPWYNAPVIPPETGYHMYSYSLDFISIDPRGSTDYGKLNNVSILPVASAAAVTGSAGTGAAGSGQNFAQTFEFILTCVNNNICRVAGGTFGFPVI